MPRITRNSQILHKARELGCAVPAFNYSDIWELLSIVKAAEEMDAPVFVATNMQSFQEQRPEFAGAMGVAAQSSLVPIVNHLDHSNSVQLCKYAVNVGYQSVMIDCSKSPLEDNIASTREVVDYAHRFDTMVEAELGQILGRNEEGSFDGGAFLADPDSCKRLAEETDVDSLAIGIGTAHGFYTSEPRIHFDIIEKVRAKTDIPLVMHGCSGVPYADVQRAIKLGMCKVNVGTQLHYTYVTHLRDQLNVTVPAKNYNIFDSFLPVSGAITAIVKEWIQVCMADGKASFFRPEKNPLESVDALAQSV
ncbi:MAG: class II fructose-bisphosphate aldolase [Planctomycetaceae bacterium]|nr:class II fructose-bisphosphate aldolase [Planctomycetaceae bacterium]